MAAKHWLDKFTYHNSIEAARRAAKPGQKIVRYSVARGVGSSTYQYVAAGPKQARDLEFDPRFRVVERIPKAKKPRAKAGRDEVRELLIFADNEPSIYNQRVSIHKNLLRKLKKGEYSDARAVKAWRGWMDSAARAYAAVHSRPRDWNMIFTPATRALAARVQASRDGRVLKMAARGETDQFVYTKNPAGRKSVRNRWGRLVRVGSFVTASHPRGGEISGTVTKLSRMSGYGIRAQLDTGYSVSVDDIRKAKTKHEGKIPRVVFSPVADIRGARVVFTRDMFPNRDSAHKNRWFVFGYSQDRQYGGHYIRRVAWPRDQPKKSRGFLRGFANRAEAARVVRALKRFVRMKGLTK